MTFLFWVIIIGLLGFTGLWLSRRQTASQQAAPGEQSTGAENTKVAEGDLVTQLTTTLRQRVTNLFNPQPPAVSPKFRVWITQALAGEPVLQQWLANLADEQLDVLATHIDTFCQEMGFELGWLLEQDLAQQPVLAKALNKVVILYCQACRQAVILQEDVEPFKLLRQYEKNPTSAQNRELGQALFAKFAEQGLIAGTMADHLALPEHERRQQIVAAIRQTATEQQATVLRLIKALIAQRHHAEESVAAAQLNGRADKATA